MLKDTSTESKSADDPVQTTAYFAIEQTDTNDSKDTVEVLKTGVELLGNYQTEQNQTDNVVTPGCNIFDCIIAFVYVIFITIRGLFPILGQVHAIHILYNWKNYIEEESETIAKYELVCASYGVYLVWLILKFLWNNIGDFIVSFYKGSWNKFIQLTPEQKQKTSMNNPIVFIFELDSKYSVFHVKNIYYNREIDMFDHFIGLIGLSIGSIGLLTIPLVWIDMYFYGDKFITQKESSAKYFFGHVFKIISTFGVHILFFSCENFFSERLANRILSRSMFGFTLIPYLIYCYFSYAIDWRYGYESRIEKLNSLNSQPNQPTQSINPNAELITIIPGEKLSPYVLFCCGTVMLTIGTGGLYWIYYIINIILTNLKLTNCEIILTCCTFGIYLIGKLWYESVKYLQSNRLKCSNIFIKIMLELTLFVLTLGMDYYFELAMNLSCLPNSKHYKVGTLQLVLFAPVITATDLNPLIRISSKLVLIGYNIIVYYFVAKVAESHNKLRIAIIVGCN